MVVQDPARTEIPLFFQSSHSSLGDHGPAQVASDPQGWGLWSAHMTTGFTGPTLILPSGHWGLGGIMREQEALSFTLTPEPLIQENKNHSCSVPEAASPSPFLILGPAARSGSPRRRPDETEAPGDNVGFNGINIQEVTHQFWLATSSWGESLLPSWPGLWPSSLLHSLSDSPVGLPTSRPLTR